MHIHQTVTINTSPDKVYRALTSSRQFGEITGAPAEISQEEGGRFSCFANQVVGRHIELVPDTRIVQAWRVDGPWPPGRYSMVSFELSSDGNATTVELRQSGYPEDFREHLEGGWHRMYWEPLRAYLESDGRRR